MERKYGFTRNDYTIAKVETLMLGDGKTSFSVANGIDGGVSIFIGYGHGAGQSGYSHEIPLYYALHEGTRWEINFDSLKSVDNLIAALVKAKDRLQSAP